MGILTIRGKKIAIAIATQPSDGSHATGTSNLTKLARWLVQHADTKRLPQQPSCG